MDKYNAKLLKERLLKSIDNPATFEYLGVFVNVILDEMRVATHYKEEGNNKMATQKYNNAYHALGSLETDIRKWEQKYWDDLVASQEPVSRPEEQHE